MPEFTRFQPADAPRLNPAGSISIGLGGTGDGTGSPTPPFHIAPGPGRMVHLSPTPPAIPAVGDCALPTNSRHGQAGVNDPYFSTSAERDAWVTAHPSCPPPPPYLPDTAPDCAATYTQWLGAQPVVSQAISAHADPAADRADAVYKYQRFSTQHPECATWATAQITALPTPPNPPLPSTPASAQSGVSWGTALVGAAMIAGATWFLTKPKKKTKATKATTR